MPNYTILYYEIDLLNAEQGRKNHVHVFSSPGNFVGLIWLNSLLRAQGDKWVRALLEAHLSLWRLRKDNVHAHVAGFDSSCKNNDSTELPEASILSICLQNILQDCTVRGGRRRRSNVKGKRHVDCHHRNDEDDEGRACEAPTAFPCRHIDLRLCGNEFHSCKTAPWQKALHLLLADHHPVIQWDL